MTGENKHGHFANNKISEVSISLKFDKILEDNQCEKISLLALDPFFNFTRREDFITFNFKFGESHDIQKGKGFNVSTEDRKSSIKIFGDTIAIIQIGKYDTFQNFVKSFDFFIKKLSNNNNIKIKQITYSKVNIFDLGVDTPLPEYFNNICPIKREGFFYNRNSSLNLTLSKKVDDNKFHLRMKQNKINDGIVTLTISAELKADQYITKILPLENYLETANNKINEIFENSISQKLKDQII